MNSISYEAISLKLLGFLKRYVDIQRESKVVLGLQIFLINICKFIVVFFLAYITETFMYSLIVFSIFALLRQVFGGVHAQSSLGCTVISVLLIIGIAFSINYCVLDMKFIFLILLVNTVMVIKYVPGDTQKNPLKCKKRIKKIRKTALKRWSCICILILLINNPELKTLLTFATIGCVLFILPISYKIFNQERPIDKIRFKLI